MKDYREEYKFVLCRRVSKDKFLFIPIRGIHLTDNIERARRYKSLKGAETARKKIMVSALVACHVDSVEGLPIQKEIGLFND